MGILDGKVAVVTGGTRGLGLEMARALARNGAAVVAGSRSQESVDQAIQLIRAEGGRAEGICTDVTDLLSVQALSQHARESFGRLDIWINNAGTAGPYGPTLDFQPEEFSKVVQTNIMGVYHGSRTALKVFSGQGSGKLINILGHGYNRPVPWQNAYGSSKAWICSFTKALAAETKSSGVGVFAFNPGMVLTELLTDVDVIEGSEPLLKSFPTVVRMWAKPAEKAAQRVVWIASPATDGKTGLVINQFSPWILLGGLMREGTRKILGHPEPKMDIKIKSIPRF